MAKLIGIAGCGWLGGAVADVLVARGDRVIGTTTTPDRMGELAAAGIEPLLVRFARGARIDLSAMKDAAAILVAIPPGSGHDAVEHARAAADAIRGTRAPHVIQISTTSVYPASGGRVVEADAERDHRLHEVEEVFRELDRTVTVLRCSGLFGPGRLVVPSLLRTGREVDPDTPVNVVERSDVVAAIVRVMAEPVDDTFNVCADEHPTREEFYRTIAGRAGLEVPRFRRSGASFRIVDNAKFRKRFAFAYAYPDPLRFPV